MRMAPQKKCFLNFFLLPQKIKEKIWQNIYLFSFFPSLLLILGPPPKKKPWPQIRVSPLNWGPQYWEAFPQWRYSRKSCYFKEFPCLLLSLGRQPKLYTQTINYDQFCEYTFHCTEMPMANRSVVFWFYWNQRENLSCLLLVSIAPYLFHSW